MGTAAMLLRHVTELDELDVSQTLPLLLSLSCTHVGGCLSYPNWSYCLLCTASKYLTVRHKLCQHVIPTECITTTSHVLALAACHPQCSTVAFGHT